MTIWQDVRSGWRSLGRSPGLVVVALISLALGIGVNAFVFSTARALVFRQLPITEPAAVFSLQALDKDGNFSNHSFPNYIELRDRVTAVADISAYRVTQVALDPGSGARSAWGYLATGNYFAMLGVQPAVGRFFTSSEDVGRNAAPFVVLSYDFWSAVFNADDQIAGRGVRINGRPYTVLGVAPAGFHGTEIFYRPDFWVPMTMASQLEGMNWIEVRNAHNIYVAGRLREGVTRDQADSALTSAAQRLASEYPRENEGLRFTLSTPGLFTDEVRRPATAFVIVTLLLAGLVLLASCTNLASLLAARVVDRLREIALRMSFGASRVQIARQLFVETLMLCIGGGVAGLVVAFILLRALTAWRPALGVPVALDVLPDAQVLWFAAATSVVAALAAVGAAARRGWRADPNTLIRSSGAPAHLGRWSVRDVLMAVQVAVCGVLVMSSFVALQGMRRTSDAKLGFNPDRVTVASFDLNQIGYDRVHGQAFRERLLETLSTAPGIDGVTFTSSVPLTTDQTSDGVVSEHAVESASTPNVYANSFAVPPGYFAVMQTRLAGGREFQPFDTADTRVVVINETLARRLFGTTDVVGRGIRRAPGLPRLEIVGVAEDGVYAMPGELPRAAVFWPAKRIYFSNTNLLVRSSLAQDQVIQEIRRAAAAIDPLLPVTIQGTMREVTSLAFVPSVAAAVALGAFGVRAVVLALTGIYGLAAYSVSTRTREIGIRAAVGGRAYQILSTVLGRTGVILMVGGAAGAALAAAANSLLAMVVYQASSRDPLVLAAGIGLMIVVGFGAAWVPARRALRIDPAVTLRES